MAEKLPSLIPIFLEHFFKDGDDAPDADLIDRPQVRDKPLDNFGGFRCREDLLGHEFPHKPVHNRKGHKGGGIG